MSALAQLTDRLQRSTLTPLALFRRVSAVCLVLLALLVWFGLAPDQAKREGVWGGLLQDERREMRLSDLRDDMEAQGRDAEDGDPRPTRPQSGSGVAVCSIFLPPAEAARRLTALPARRCSAVTKAPD